MVLHLLEETMVLEMLPVLFFLDPCQGFIDREDDQKREIRADRPPCMQYLEPGKRVIDISLESLLLVGIPAVRVTVRDDEESAFEGGADQGGEMGCMIGCKEEGLGYGISLLGDCLPHLVTDPGGPRLAGKDRREI